MPGRSASGSQPPKPLPTCEEPHHLVPTWHHWVRRPRDHRWSRGLSVCGAIQTRLRPGSFSGGSVSVSVSVSDSDSDSESESETMPASVGDASERLLLSADLSGRVVGARGSNRDSLAGWTTPGAGIVELSPWHGDCCSQRHALPSTCNPSKREARLHSSRDQGPSSCSASTSTYRLAPTLPCRIRSGRGRFSRRHPR